MNYHDQLCQAIDLLAQDQDDAAHTLLEQTISEIKRFLPEAVDACPLYLAWGQALELLEEPEQALLQYEKALQSNPDFEEAWAAMATLLIEELDRLEEAATLIQARLLPLESDQHQRYQEMLDRIEIDLRHSAAPSHGQKPQT